MSYQNPEDMFPGTVHTCIYIFAALNIRVIYNYVICGVGLYMCISSINEICVQDFYKN